MICNCIWYVGFKFVLHKQPSMTIFLDLDLGTPKVAGPALDAEGRLTKRCTNTGHGHPCTRAFRELQKQCLADSSQSTSVYYVYIYIYIYIYRCLCHKLASSNPLDHHASEEVTPGLDVSSFRNWLPDDRAISWWSTVRSSHMGGHSRKVKSPNLSEILHLNISKLYLPFFRSRWRMMKINEANLPDSSRFQLVVGACSTSIRYIQLHPPSTIFQRRYSNDALATRSYGRTLHCRDRRGQVLFKLLSCSASHSIPWHPTAVFFAAFRVSCSVEVLPYSKKYL